MNKLYILLIIFLPFLCYGKDFHIEPWRLGMSILEVSEYSDFGPYTGVQATAGLETKNGKIFDEKRNISFVFDEEGLEFIQVWNYEGHNWKVAKDRVLEIHKLFVDKFEGAQVENVNINNQKWIGRNDLETVLTKILGTAKKLAKENRKELEVEMTIFFDMVPKIQPTNSNLHSLWGYSGRHDMFYVFLYQDRKKSKLRKVKSNIDLEAL